MVHEDGSVSGSLGRASHPAPPVRAPFCMGCSATALAAASRTARTQWDNIGQEGHLADSRRVDIAEKVLAPFGT